MTYTRDEVIAAQDSFNALTPVYVQDRNQLNTTISEDLTLNADDGLTTIIAATTVVYNATSLTTAAGVTLTLEGNYDWVFKNLIGVVTKLIRSKPFHILSRQCGRHAAVLYPQFKVRRLFWAFIREQQDSHFNFSHCQKSIIIDVLIIVDD